MIKVLVDGREMVVDLDKNLVMSADGKPIPADSPLVEKAKQAAQKYQTTADPKVATQQQTTTDPKVSAQQQTTTDNKVVDKLQNHATKANAEQVGKVAGTLAAAGGAMAGSAAAVRDAADPTSDYSRASADMKKQISGRQQADAQRNYQVASRDERKEADKDAAAQAASQYQQTMAQISGAAGGGAAALAAMNVQKGDPNQHRQRADAAHKTASSMQDAADQTALSGIRDLGDAASNDKQASDRATQNIKSGQYSIAPDYGAASEGNGGSGEQQPTPGNGGEQNPAPGEHNPAPQEQQPTPGNGGEQQPAPDEQQPAPGNGGEQQPAPGNGGEQQPAPGNGGEQQPTPADNELPGMGFTLNDAQVGYTEAVGKQSGATPTSEAGKNRAKEYFERKGVSENGDPNNAGAELQAWRRKFAGDSVDAVGNTTYKDASRMTGGDNMVVDSDRRLKNILTAVNRRFY